jgi:hypothetical protein
MFSVGGRARLAGEVYGGHEPPLADALMHCKKGFSASSFLAPVSMALLYLPKQSHLSSDVSSYVSGNGT